jgi:hypothetical protein
VEYYAIVPMSIQPPKAPQTNLLYTTKTFNLTSGNTLLEIRAHFDGDNGEFLAPGSETMTLTGPSTNITETIFSSGNVPYQDYFLNGTFPPGSYTLQVSDNQIAEASGYIYILALTVPNT